MVEKESHPYPHLPSLPDPWPRPPDVVPAAASLPVDAGGGPAPSREPQTIGQQPAVAEDQPTTPTEGTEPGPEQAEYARVKLAGRLGQNPTMRTSRNGVLIARFPLAVKDELDLNKTTWHQVLAFRERAAMVRDTLHKGDAVEVIGYKHRRDIPGRNGPRTVEEIYATVIKQRS